MRRDMSVLSPLIAELKWSLKWTLILIVPVAIACALLATILGGIEGGAKALYLFALAPMLVLEPVTTSLDGPIVWGIFAVAEFSYLFLIVLMGRALWRRFA
jgi:hypothetical protein